VGRTLRFMEAYTVNLNGSLSEIFSNLEGPKPKVCAFECLSWY